ncbi:MAG TPA: hypothetical protein VD907_06090 [Verrucomicrobiae bacterium]|nr:hypothetical protein [Verrucomicrobiae bacterium]
MNQPSPQIKNAKRMMLIFAALSLFLSALFVIEYVNHPNESPVGRVPLLIISVVACVYYATKYFSGRKK